MDTNSKLSPAVASADLAVTVGSAKRWTHTEHDGEIFISYNGTDSGILWPAPDFTMWHINATLATLNAYFPTEPAARHCSSHAPKDVLTQEIEAHTGRLAGTSGKGPDFESGFIAALKHVRDNILPLLPNNPDVAGRR